MDLFETVSTRRSYRGPLKDTPVPRDDLQRIVQAGIDAPSGCNEQSTAFVIVDDPEMITEIGQLPHARQNIKEAKAIVACIIDRNPDAVYEGFAFQVEDCAAAVQNMLLAIHALGYASVWIDGWLRREGKAEKIGELLGVPDNKVVRVILPIGVAAEALGTVEKKSFDERASFNQFGV